MKIQVPLPSQMFTCINHFYICHFLLNIFDLSVIFIREKDFIQERESLLQQQAEKDQQYDDLVRSLKDRVSSSTTMCSVYPTFLV